MASGLVPARAADPLIDEYRVKAAFLYNFAKFLEWPPEAFPNDTSPILLCVLGTNPFGRDLQELVRDKEVRGRSFQVRLLSRAKDAGDCHIVFLSGYDRRSIAAALVDLKTNPYALTVGESESFLADGGVLNFVVRDAHVRIQVDSAGAAHAKYKISSKLLSIVEAPKK